MNEPVSAQQIAAACGVQESSIDLALLQETAPVLFERWNGHKGLWEETLRWLACDTEVPEVPAPDAIDEATAMTQLRRWRNAAFAAASIRDILGIWHPRTVARYWSDVADALLSWAWDWSACHHKPAADWILQQTVLIGLGKLGGRDLNLSSDIDIVFFCAPPDPETFVADRPQLYAFVQKLVDLLGRNTPDGFVYRVDLRLRPMGDQGNLVDPIDVAEVYYRDLSAPWERIALLKYRAICGAASVADALQQRIEPVLFKKHLDYIIVEEIQSVREKIALESKVRIAGTSDIKLSEGGIREIEFFTQSHLLLHGGRIPALRQRDQEPAMQALAEHGILPAAQCEQLMQDYWLLRAIENRIQQRADQQTQRYKIADVPRWQASTQHLLPDNVPLEQALPAARKRIAEAFESMRAPDAAETEWHALTLVALSESLTEAEKAAQLAENGITNAETVLAHLQSLRLGPRESAYGRRARQQFERVGQHLIDRIWAAPAPEKAAENLSTFIGRIGGRAEIYALLQQNPPLVELLLRILSTSGRLTRMLMAAPGLLDGQLLAPLSLDNSAIWQWDDIAEGPSPDERLEDLCRTSGEDIVRIGLRLLSGESDFLHSAGELSLVAERALHSTMRIALHTVGQRHGLQPAEAEAALVPIAMGRLAGRELAFSSDLDLIYLRREDTHNWQPDQLARAIQRCGNWMNMQTRYGTLFEMDLRLRPSGNAGPLTTTRAALCKYHQESAGAWERLTLLKARPLHADAAVVQEAETTIDMALRQRHPVRQDLEDLIHMRNRIVQERGQNEQFKAAAGTIMDLEFSLGIAMLHFIDRGDARPPVDLQGHTTYLTDAGWFDSQQARRLHLYNQILRGIQVSAGLLGREADWDTLAEEWPRWAALVPALGNLLRATGIDTTAAFQTMRTEIESLWERTIETVRQDRYNIE